MTEARFLVRPGEPRLAWQLDAARTPIRARVVLVHGYAEHRARYERVVDAWTAQGIAVARLDLRGHGQSEGARGHVGSIGEYVRDVTSVLGAAEHDSAWSAGGRPVLFGHSLGGLVATHAALELVDRIAGLAMTSPFFGLARPVPGIQLGLAKVFGKLAPRLRQPSGLVGSDLTHDPEIAASYDHDPLGFHHVTAGWFLAVVAAQREAMAVAPRVKVPAYCIAAGDDRVVSTPATERIFGALGSPEKELDVRAGLFHEVLNEPDWREHASRLAERITRWGAG
jgi:alpha-beta hydrolase superfamily lysophospholipase